MSFTRKFTENAEVNVRTTDRTETLNLTVVIDKIDPAPSIPQLNSVKTTLSSITATYDEATSQSGIKNYACYYGENANELLKKETTASKCVFDNLDEHKTYYYKICAINNAMGESCSTLSSAITELVFEGVSDIEYSKGQSITYQNNDFYVLKDNGDTITMITKNNVGTGKYGDTTNFSDSDVSKYLNNTWIMQNEKLREEMENGGIIKDPKTDTYVRIIEVNELDSNLNNTSGTPYWTMTSENNKVWYATSGSSTTYNVYTKASNGTISGCVPTWSSSGSATTERRSYPTYKINTQSATTLTEPTRTTASNGYTYSNVTSSNRVCSRCPWACCLAEAEGSGSCSSTADCSSLSQYWCIGATYVSDYNISSNEKNIGYRAVITVKKK